MKNIKLFTKNLVLREIETHDKDALLDIISHPKFDFYSFPPPTKDLEILNKSAKSFIKRMQILKNSNDITQKRENYKLAVCLKDNPDIMIGYVAFDEINEIRGEVRDIGYFIHPDYWRNGYATEAAEKLLNYLAPELNSDTIWATVHPDNNASQAVLSKLGFLDTGKRKTNDAGEPRLIYSVNRQSIINRPIYQRKLVI